MENIFSVTYRQFKIFLSTRIFFQEEASKYSHTVALFRRQGSVLPPLLSQLYRMVIKQVKLLYSHKLTAPRCLNGGLEGTSRNTQLCFNLASSSISPPSSEPQSFSTVDKDLGSHCQYAFCNPFDFHLFRCESCRGSYLDHGTGASHE